MDYQELKLILSNFCAIMEIPAQWPGMTNSIRDILNN
jgi:hypothetical protein